MAPGRLAVGGLTIVAVVLALVVAGCGGGDSSASGAVSTGSTDGGASAKVEAGGGSQQAGAGASKQKGESTQKPESAPSAEEQPAGKVEGGGKKKHPPLQLPAGRPEEGPTKEQVEAVPTANIVLTVPGGLTASNTCKGKDLSPAISWKGVPASTSELALFVMNLQPVNGKLYFDYAVAGIDPSLEELKAGEVPDGAIVGRNSAGKDEYDLCPHGSAPENYIFALYAIPQGVSPKSGFDPLELRNEATDLSESVGLYSVAY